MTALLDLAARCEAATGPDRELDHAVHAAVYGNAGYCGDEGWLCAACSLPAHQLTQEPGCRCPMGISDERTSMPSDWRDDERLRRVSASLDAAISLVPEGHIYLSTNADVERETPNIIGGSALVGHPDSVADIRPVVAATPALALCAAALRARAQ